MFCVALWFLDDMWYYSLFTLFMLMIFESTVVFQRLKNLQEFRAMSIQPYPLFVFRRGKWDQTQSDQLLPGDIISITRQKDDSPVPVDCLLIDGSCIANEAMLSGESTPQMKESIALREPEDVLDMSNDRIHVLFGGTKVLQVTAGVSGCVPISPDSGAIGYVVRSGFATQQGKLVRTIIFSTERVTANNLESLFFILFLLIFAVIASWYVWTEGSKDEDRSQSKLLLHCILIITSVVPPELPMELSLAVNNSLVALSKMYIFCTEPFRIPFAGRVDVACFDKTGTLTAENLIVEGVTGLNLSKKGSDGQGPEALLGPHQLPLETIMPLAAAHALAKLDDGIIGDPMEKNTLEFIDWTLSSSDIIKSRGKANMPILKVLRRFQFSSQLKRMSTISSVTDPLKSKLLVAVKGAPETLQVMYKDLPNDYEETYKHWARRGKRVLAIGYKYLESTDKVKDLHREDVESGLTFAGFLVFFCPLKRDAITAVTMLNAASHRCIMITGDNALTACHVAKEVQISTRDILVGDVRSGGGN